MAQDWRSLLGAFQDPGSFDHEASGTASRLAEQEDISLRPATNTAIGLKDCALSKRSLACLTRLLRPFFVFRTSSWENKDKREIALTI